MGTWSKEQVEYLREAYPRNERIRVLAKQLGKDPRAIGMKAIRLGLRRSEEGLPNGFRRCPDCKEVKSLDDGFRYRQGTCKACEKRRTLTDPKYQAAAARIHHRKAGIVKEGHDLTADEWIQILTEYGDICPACGEPFTEENPATRDCIIPLAQGGTLTKSNVQPLHNKCNNRKGKRVVRYEPVLRTT